MHFHATSLTKPPYCICLGYPLPPHCAEIICTCPLTELLWRSRISHVSSSRLPDTRRHRIYRISQTQHGDTIRWRGELASLHIANCSFVDGHFEGIWAFSMPSHWRHRDIGTLPQLFSPPRRPSPRAAAALGRRSPPPPEFSAEEFRVLFNHIACFAIFSLVLAV